MISNEFEFRPDIVIPLEFGSKRRKGGKDRKEARRKWNQTNAGKSKARLGKQEALGEKSGKQNIKNH